MGNASQALRQDLCQELKLDALRTRLYGSTAGGEDLDVHWMEVAMPKAMVSIIVAQIAPGTIRHGVRLIEGSYAAPGLSRAPRDFRLCRIDLPSAEVQIPLQFLRATQPHAHRNSNAADPYPTAPAE